jgi:hypothetical protein
MGAISDTGFSDDHVLAQMEGRLLRILDGGSRLEAGAQHLHVRSAPIIWPSPAPHTLGRMLAEVHACAVGPQGAMAEVDTAHAKRERCSGAKAAAPTATEATEGRTPELQRPFAITTPGTGAPRSIPHPGRR